MLRCRPLYMTYFYYKIAIESWRRYKYQDPRKNLLGILNCFDIENKDYSVNHNP